MTRLAIAALLLACVGCLEAPTNTCADGRVCPPGLVCSATTTGCFNPTQIDRCSGLADEASCDWPDPGAGVCRGDVCIEVGCGNGFVDDAETCDDGNITAGDGCSPECKLEACGNAILDPGEQCDCGSESFTGQRPAGCDAANSANAATCRADCMLHCGDGARSAKEVCDPTAPDEPIQCADVGFDLGMAGCTSFCTLDTQSCRVIGLVPMGVAVDGAFNDVWYDGNRIFLVGQSDDGTVDALIAHYTGTEWQSFHNDTGFPLEAIDVGASEAFAVGQGGGAYRFDGTGWTSEDTNTTSALNAVWIDPTGTAYAVGDGGTILRRAGVDSWQVEPSGTSQTLRGIWGDGTSVYAVGDLGTLLKRTAGTWAPIDLSTNNHLHSVAGTGPADVWVVGNDSIYRWDGAQWSDIGSNVLDLEQLRDVWASSSQVFVVGQNGAMLRWDGVVWKRLLLDPGHRLAVHGADPSDLVVLRDDGQLGHYRGYGWALFRTNVQAPSYKTIAGAHRGDLWAGGLGSVVRSFGPGWFSDDNSPLNDVSAMHVNSVDDVWSAGAGSNVAHWNGASWTAEQLSLLGQPLYGIWGTSAGQMFAVGPGSGVWHRVGTTWGSLAEPTPGFLRGIWGASGTDVWAVGEMSSIARWNGTTWSQVASSVANANTIFYGVWGTASDNVYIAGSHGTLLHHDGASLTEVALDESVDLLSVDGSGPDDVFVVGRVATVHHWDGVRWSRIRVGSTVEVRDVWVSPELVAFATAQGVLELLRPPSP